MKKVTLFFTFCLSMVLINSLDAQITCCDASGTTVAPEIQTGMHATLIPMDQNTPTQVLAVNASADLPNVEFLITKRGTAALMDDGNGNMVPDTSGGGGDVLIGTDADGMIMPNSNNRYGITLAPGDIFDVYAIGFDLPVIQNLADSLLVGVSPSSGPCCGLFVVMANAFNQPALEGFCDSVNSKGIYRGSDVENIGDVLTMFDLFSSGQLSVPAITYVFNLINSNGFFISTDCGGAGSNQFLPIGINPNSKYSYETTNPVAVQMISEISRFVIFPNPAADQLQINLTSDAEVDLSINLFDALGQRVKNENLGNVSGDYNVVLDIENLPSGIYSLELTDGHKNVTQKVVVQ